MNGMELSRRLLARRPCPGVGRGGLLLCLPFLCVGRGCEFPEGSFRHRPLAAQNQESAEAEEDAC